MRVDRGAAGDVAVVGMACLFPGAPDLETYWNNIVGKVSAIGDPPPGWAAADVFDPASAEPDRIYCQRGGFLGELSRFDPTAYGVMPLAVDGAEPEHFLALRVAHEALADAGYLSRPFDRDRAGVILGRGTFLNRGSVTALQHGLVVDQTLGVLRQLRPDLDGAALDEVRRQLKASLPPFNAETAPGLVSNVMCGRIANRLDLKGPTYAVDAACASSLVAVDLGIRDLLSGRSDLMLVGGVNVSTPPLVFMVFCQLGALSRRGQIRPFDADADGVLLGEGVGMVVLKRRADAERDGDRIYAVVKGVGIASDGRALAVLAPRLEGEELAIRRAYEAAGVSPDSVGLVEAHGTGTPVGDLTEIEALRRVFGDGGGRPPRCALGSVKSMISHTIPAAGVAGLIKAATALYQKVLPPTLGVERPNPKLGLDRTPFYLGTEPRPWIHGGPEPRRAGVNAFGFGGINAHVVLEEATGRDEAATPDLWRAWDSEVVVVDGAGRGEILAKVEALRRRLAATPGAPLAAVAAEVDADLADGTLRLAVVATSTADLDAKLAHAEARLAEAACRRIRDVSGIYFAEEPLLRQGALGFLFPGEGAQYAGMLQDLCMHFPEVRACFDQADRVFGDGGRAVLPSQVLFPPPLGRPADEAALWQADCAVAAVFAANRALSGLLGRLGVAPAAVVGHSSGEYAALLHAGAIRAEAEAEVLRQGLRLNALYRAVEERIPPAVLLTVGAVRPGTIEAVGAEFPDAVHVAMDNCPHQVVLSVAEADAPRVMDALGRRGAICAVLPFRRAYHTPHFASVTRELDGFFRGLSLAAPHTPVYSCATAAPYPVEPEAIRQVALSQWTRPVRFRETIRAMHAAGVRVFVDVGPRGTLVGFVQDILRGQPHVAVATNVPQRSGVAQLHHAVGLLAAHGASLRLGALYARRGLGPGRERAGATPPASRSVMRVALELPTARVTARAPGLAAAPGAPPAPLLPAAPSPAGSRPEGADEPLAPAGGGTPRARVMLEHLRRMERFLAIQEEVMQAYLGGRAPAGSAPAADDRPAGRSARATAGTPGPEPRPQPAASPTPLPATEAAGSREALVGRLLAIVSDKTGYPPEMLDLGSNMEADLGIDSIKRVEILGAFQRATGLLPAADMERASALKTLAEIVDLALARGSAVPARPAPDAAAATPAGGFVSRILSHTPDEEAMAECVLDAEADAFLRDHAIGGRPSNLDATLSALPVVPLTVSLAIMAEVAALLRPGSRVVRLRDVRALRWFPVEGRRRVLVSAKRRRSEVGTAVEVQILEGDDGGPTEEGRPIVEGVVLLGDAYEPPPPAADLVLGDERPFRFAPSDLYGEVMFHGPRFQSVVAVRRSGAEGAEAAVRGGRATGFFEDAGAELLLDPVLLDAAGQVVGFWAADRLASGAVVFPVGFERLDLHGSTTASTATTCRARTRAVADGRLRSDVDFLDGDGAPLVRITGWEDRRFDFSRDVVRFVLRPGEVAISAPWPEAVAGLPGAGDLECCRLEPARLPRELFEEGAPLWQTVWARLILGRAEREAWMGVRHEGRRAHWLLGRLAAKDAVRRLVAARHGLRLSPADVEITTDAQGAPRVGGAWVADVGRAPAVTLAHTDLLVVAVAGWCPDGEGIGVDVEAARAPSEELMAVAFSPAERRLLAPRRGDSDGEWALRAWCAKEAVGKALGHGLPGGPRTLVVRQVDRGTGEIRMVPAGGLAAPAARPARAFSASTRRQGEAIVASARVTGIVARG